MLTAACLGQSRQAKRDCKWAPLGESLELMSDGIRLRFSNNLPFFDSRDFLSSRPIAISLSRRSRFRFLTRWVPNRIEDPTGAHSNLLCRCRSVPWAMSLRRVLYLLCLGKKVPSTHFSPIIAVNDRSTHPSGWSDLFIAIYWFRIIAIPKQFLMTAAMIFQFVFSCSKGNCFLIPHLIEDSSRAHWGKSSLKILQCHFDRDGSAVSSSKSHSEFFEKIPRKCLSSFERFMGF